MTTIIHQITSGMAGWLTYEHMRKGLDNLREAELKKPIELLAQGWGYEVIGEFPLPREPGKKGAPPSIDFILVNRKRKIVVALELKYKKTDRKMAGSIGFDAARLHDLTIDTINTQIVAGKAGPIKLPVNRFELHKAVLIAWHQTGIMEQLKIESAEIKTQFMRLLIGLLPAGVESTGGNLKKAMLGKIATKQVGNQYGSLRAGATITGKRFWVASFLHQPNWNSIIGK